MARCLNVYNTSLFLLCLYFTKSIADTPANCSYEEVQGKWMFAVGQKGQDKTIKCTTVGPVTEYMKVELDFPDVAVDEFGNRGFWTLIYNQGFEVVVNGRKFFAFSKWEGKGENVTSYCDQTMPGWSHDVLGHDWACFEGKRLDSKPHPKVTKTYLLKQSIAEKTPFRHNSDFISKINSIQSSWKAVRYTEYESYSLEDMTRRAGGRKSKIHGRPKPASPDKETLSRADKLPRAFDWRKVNGINFVSPVRNQAACGSCYAFSSMALNEARVRIKSNLTQTPVFSPQDIVECSSYSQGCEGGFPYLIGGKYAEDFGLVEEMCNPYKGADNKCHTKKTCRRHYSTDYRYVGGFYGGCNEALMRLALVEGGPLSVSFEVYGDFQQYKGGIYHHTGLQDKFNPFEITNHAVLLVGYGQDETTGEKYWTIKNSWGENWGESGYFRIRRGTDECSIESIAVESFPIF